MYLNWRILTLQYCGGFCHTFTWISYGYTCVPHPDPPSHLPHHPFPQSHPSAPTLGTLSHASNLDWWSISHMIIYMFQCYSLKSSHPRLLPQSPKVCSLHLCLFCCLAYRVIVTIFLLNCKSSEPSPSVFRYPWSSAAITFIGVRNSDSPTKLEAPEKWELGFKFLLYILFSLSSDSTKEVCSE